MTDAIDQLSVTVGEDDQRRLAARAANDGAIAAGTWHVAEMHGNMGGGTHLYRVSGGQDDSKWSYVIKILDRPSEGFIATSEDPSAWMYWKREWLVYQAPWLRALNGSLTPPVCLGTGVGLDGRLWIALGDQAHFDDRPWPLERFGTVSRHIGEFNSKFVDEATRPVDDWLSRDFIQGWTERSGQALAQLPALLSNPLVAQTYSPRSVDGLTRTWDGRHALYRVLNALPQTLCHLDLNGRNVFFAGDVHTVAIDWAYAGIAPLGQDLAALVGGSLLLLEAPFDQADELESLCLRNYLDGLTAGGWSGSERDAELGYLISLVLRMGIGPIVAAVAVGLNEDLHPYAERAFGHPVAEYLKSVSRVAEFSLERIDRIHEMVDF